MQYYHKQQSNAGPPRITSDLWQKKVKLTRILVSLTIWESNVTLNEDIG